MPKTYPLPVSRYSTKRYECDAEAIVLKLAFDGALTSFQAKWVIEQWATLPADWSCHPYCRQIGEHTAAFIDARRLSRAFVGSKQRS
jgi:hypothetical protein